MTFLLIKYALPGKKETPFPYYLFAEIHTTWFPYKTVLRIIVSND